MFYSTDILEQRTIVSSTQGMLRGQVNLGVRWSQLIAEVYKINGSAILYSLSSTFGSLHIPTRCGKTGPRLVFKVISVQTLYEPLSRSKVLDPACTYL